MDDVASSERLRWESLGDEPGFRQRLEDVLIAAAR
ncbi:hypothetical protein DSM3645_12321 [Blastopirellula marina DSM 3645]|uniref:Uncharacterized protein n=1 Tax=Blastopirellula marina DSM 3645 TaxID=314230 RepID=A3ZRN4_9BACT|nr:hypothetical protein DSM3645_12321 [Blastopirellula marina DSM 3645]